MNAENKEKTPLVGYENVIKFFGVASDESALYLVLEYADLGNLRKYLSDNNLNWNQKINIGRQITCGLYFLHRNEIVHCDLHTKNVVIHKNGDGIRAIITDFGLSKVLTRNSTSDQQIGGCVGFVDPKLLDSNGGTPDYKSDIYSLGVVLWEITSDGRKPFKEHLSKAGSIRVSIEILRGMREKPIKGSTISYVELYTNCWNGNPDSRPKIEQVYKSIHQEDIITGEKWKQPIEQVYKSIHQEDTITGERWKQPIEQVYKSIHQEGVKTGVKTGEKLSQRPKKGIPQKLFKMFEQFSTKDLKMISPELVQSAARQRKREKGLSV
ncbi:kinase-like domain-containing protein [Gigaspora rosea]|uniref:Kinase-like domain-containing protein n=1 Tax=Gigaspora rosea TaxID=44941 RepID=A0A397VZP6_9GLOM|nr:kinase-like domain-containing protein [Gigaspora rosea]